MHAARYHGPHDVRVEEVEPDPLGPGDVRVDVAACGICGSDLHVYEGRGSVPEEPHPVTGQHRPLTMGHEVGGTVAEVGEGVDLEVGTTVAINPLVYCGDCRYCRAGDYNLCEVRGFVGLASNGGFADNLVVPAEQAVPVPDGLSAELAALVEPFTVGLRAVRRSPIRAGDSVAVFGAGPIGLGLVQEARAAGAGELFVSEPNDARRAVAGDCGADVLVDPTEVDAVEVVADATNGGVDVALEAAGNEASVAAALEATKAGGWVTVVSLFMDAISVQPNHVVSRERTVTGSASFQGGPLSAETFGRTMRAFVRGTLDPERLVTARIGVDDIVEEGFEALLDPEGAHLKVLVTP